MHRHAYYEALDLVSKEVERRFQQSDINTIKEIEVRSLVACFKWRCNRLYQILL